MNKKPKTWIDMARMVFGDISEREADRVLWEATCFPFGKPAQVLRQLREGKREGGGTVDGAINYAYAQLEEAMRSTADA